MAPLFQSELIQAFRHKNSKRRELIYYGYQAWFELPLSAEALADRIKDHLRQQEADLPYLDKLNEQFIYQIRAHLRRKGLWPPAPPVLSTLPSSTLPASHPSSPARLQPPHIPDLSASRPNDMISFH